MIAFIFLHEEPGCHWVKLILVIGVKGTLNYLEHVISAEISIVHFEYWTVTQICFMRAMNHLKFITCVYVT
jgi:hypothetical protein